MTSMPGLKKLKFVHAPVLMPPCSPLALHPIRSPKMKPAKSLVVISGERSPCNLIEEKQLEVDLERDTMLEAC
jgi:hypothetical protein